MTVAINTPNGTIGRALALQLLDAGTSVRILSRTADKAADLVSRGAELVLGSTDDPAALKALFEGVDAIFWLNPPLLHRDDFFEWSEAAARLGAAAAVEAGVARAVVMSSMGAQLPEGTGPIASAHRVERAFFAALPDVTALRAGFFMENFFGNLPTIASEGRIYHAAPQAARVPMVSTGDIAAAAFDRLQSADWSGHHRLGVHGPADLTHDEAAALIGEGLGRKIEAVAVPPAGLEQALLGAGLPPNVASRYREMFEAIHSGLLTVEEPRSAQTTTPTSLTDFARAAIAPALASMG